ncbi:hypothetical protein [Nocardia sp. BMG51109]|uniref:hypothetical protein n=1 Tax=Nocardia sp. BMG51109 TaxID=1056816 RepID=UPI0004669AD5|nr:hypothetical protein [Nocardia sp. BMG51109]
MVVELSDQLIDRMFAIGLRVHNELVRSRRAGTPRERRQVDTVTITCAIDELDRLIRTTRTSVDQLDGPELP